MSFTSHDQETDTAKVLIFDLAGGVAEVALVPRDREHGAGRLRLELRDPVPDAREARPVRYVVPRLEMSRCCKMLPAFAELCRARSADFCE